MVPAPERRYPRSPRQPRPDLKPLASKSGATVALSTVWVREAPVLRLMEIALMVGRGIFNEKQRHKEAADYLRLLARIEKLKAQFPRLWRRVIAEDPEPYSWGVSRGWQRLLREFAKSKAQSSLMMNALKGLALSDLHKRTAQQVVTVVVMCALRVAKKRAPSGTELALLAVMTGMEEPVTSSPAQRQRPDTWDNCIKACRPWVDSLLDTAPVELCVFPDDFHEK